MVLAGSFIVPETVAICIFAVAALAKARFAASPADMCSLSGLHCDTEPVAQQKLSSFWCRDRVVEGTRLLV